MRHYEFTKPPSRFSPYVQVLGSTAKDLCYETMKDAVEVAVEVTEEVQNMPIAIDGTWQNRGHTSLNGVVTATSFDTGKVVGVSCHLPGNGNSEGC